MFTRTLATLSTAGLTLGALTGLSLPASAAEVLPAPTGLVVTKTGNHTVWLDWDDVAGAERYVIYYNPVSDPGAEKKTYTVKSDAPPSERVISTATLLNGVDYEFEVAAQDINSGTATSPKSTAVYATPVSPAVPADFRVEYVGNERVYFEWNAVPLAQGYYISTEVYDDNGIGNAKVPAIKFFSTAAKEQAEYVSGLTNGVTYRFRIATRMDNQAGDYSADQDAPLGTPLAVPGSPNVTKKTVSKSAITVTLTKPAAQAGVPVADRYRVVFTPNLGEPNVVDTDTTTATVSGLLAGMTYSITAQAGNANGYGPYDFTPLMLVAADKPGAVLNASATREEDGSVAVLTWDAPKSSGGAERPNYYNISVNPLDPQDYDPPNQKVTDPAAVFAGLTTDGDYTFGITAVTDGGNGPMVLTGSLAQAPTAGAVSYDDTSGEAAFAFTPVDNDYLDYQVQAYQRVTVGSSALKQAKRDGLLSTLQGNSATTVVPDSVDCSANACVALFPRFADNINGTAWDFRVRAYDGLYSASNWARGTLPVIADVASSTDIVSTPSISCPEGTLIDSQCLLPDGSISRTPAQVFTTHEVATTFPWSARESSGVVNFFVNGSTYAGQPVSLGRCPGTVSLEFTGLAGSSSSSTELCSQAVSLPGPVGDLEGTSSGSSVTLSWTAPTIGQVPVTGYTVSWKQGGSRKTQNASGTSTTVSGLSAGKDYTFMVAANTTYGTSTGVGTEVDVESGQEVPQTPGNVKAQSGPGSITVSWSAPEAQVVTSYTVEYGTDASSLEDSDVTAGTSLTIEDLDPSQTYYARVIANGPGGSSLPSPLVSAVPAEKYNSAAGGAVVEVENYLGSGQTWRVHTFTENDTLYVSNATQPFRVLVIGGGGGGGGRPGGDGHGGGGGGGEIVYDPTFDIPTGPHMVKIGAGGTKGADSIAGSNGGTTSLGALIEAIGGGGGGERGPNTSQRNGRPGANGGGGGGAYNAGDPGNPGGSATLPQGKSGGSGGAGWNGGNRAWAGGGGGGGGFGSPGGPGGGEGARGGSGGAGLDFDITGQMIGYGGGGAGHAWGGPAGAVSHGGAPAGSNAPANRGGGGGASGTGGSGVVIIAYQVG